MVQVTDNLVDPMGEPLEGVTIRVTSLTNKVTLVGIPAEVITDSVGAYSFSLVQGEHLIEVLFDDEFITSGEVVIDANTASPLTINTLLVDYAKES